MDETKWQRNQGKTRHKILNVDIIKRVGKDIKQKRTQTKKIKHVKTSKQQDYPVLNKIFMVR